MAVKPCVSNRWNNPSVDVGRHITGMIGRQTFAKSLTGSVSSRGSVYAGGMARKKVLSDIHGREELLVAGEMQISV